MNTKVLVVLLAAVALLAAAVDLVRAQSADRLTLPGDVRLNQRQPPEFVLRTIGLRPGMTVGEVGAGWGRYTVQIASRVGPGGMVYANDVDRGSLDRLRQRLVELQFRNVEIVVGTATETRLPAQTMDLVIMVNVIHCLTDPVPLLRGVAATLKPGAQLAVVEGNLDKLPTGARGWLPRARLLDLFESAGYRLVREDASLPEDNIYLFTPREPAGD